MLEFPLRPYVGNSETELWDDAAALVELNQRVHAGERFSNPWPAYLLAIGEVNGTKTAIDLRTPGAPVWWVDRVIDAPGTGQTHTSFNEWATSCMNDLRHDLGADGIDADATPEQREEDQKANAKAGCRCLIYFVLIAVGFTALILAAIRLLHR